MGYIVGVITVRALVSRFAFTPRFVCLEAESPDLEIRPP